MAEPVPVFVSHHYSPEEDAFTARDVRVDIGGVGATGSYTPDVV